MSGAEAMLDAVRSELEDYINGLTGMEDLEDLYEQVTAYLRQGDLG